MDSDSKIGENTIELKTRSRGGKMKKIFLIVVCVVFAGALFAQSGEDFLLNSFNPFVQPGLKSMKCSISFEFDSDNAQMAMAAQIMPKMVISYIAPDNFSSELKFSDSVPPMMQQMVKPMLKNMTKDQMAFVDYTKGLEKMKKDFIIGNLVNDGSSYQLTLIPKNKKKIKMESMTLVFDKSKKLVEIKMEDKNNEVSVVKISYKNVGSFMLYDRFKMNVMSQEKKMTYSMVYGEYEINK